MQPYGQSQVYIQNIIDMTELYYNEFTLDLDSFMANVFLELRLYYDSRVCVGVGYQCDNI